MLFVLMLLNKREANNVFICDHLCMFVEDINQLLPSYTLFQYDVIVADVHTELIGPSH